MEKRKKEKEHKTKDGFDGETIEYDEVETGESNKIKKIKKELEVCRGERQEYLSGWQRARADLVNQQKEMEDKVERVGGFAQEEFAIKLLPVLDSFDMAFANKDVWEKVDRNWRVGIEHIYSNFLSVLSDYKITPFDPTGESFNPAEHESLESKPTNKKEEDGLVIEVLQKGYKHDKIVLRPAKVKVATYKSN